VTEHIPLGEIEPNTSHLPCLVPLSVCGVCALTTISKGESIPSDQRQVRSLVLGDAPARALPARRTPIPAGQGRIDPGFINEFAALHRERADLVLIHPAGVRDPGGIPFRGVE
jgi:hypothetical protein